MKKFLILLFFILPISASAGEVAVVSNGIISAVDKYYIKEQNKPELRMNFLKSFQEIDDKIKILEKHGNIMLTYQGVLVDRIKKPKTNGDWGNLIENSMNRFKKHSYIMAGMTNDKIIKMMADKLLQGLDSYSYYNPVALPFDVVAKTKSPQISFTNEKYGAKPKKSNGYLTIEITSFDKDTSDRVKDAIKQYKLYSKQPLNGIFIDVRGNKGGSLQQAVKTADLFLDKGKIATVKGRNIDTLQVYYADKSQIAAGVPIIVLVNSTTASSAELFAAALGENGRAKIVGEKTYGKSSVQTGVPLANGGEVVLTWAHFLTPSGMDIQQKGIDIYKKIPQNKNSKKYGYDIN